NRKRTRRSTRPLRNRRRPSPSLLTRSSDRMAETSERQALLSSLQRAIDAVPETPTAEDGADDSAAGRDTAGPPSAGSAAAGSAAEDAGDGVDEEAIREASKRAYAILALRDHSRVEMKQKLVGRGH